MHYRPWAQGLGTGEDGKGRESLGASGPGLDLLLFLSLALFFQRFCRLFLIGLICILSLRHESPLCIRSLC